MVSDLFMALIQGADQRFCHISDEETQTHPYNRKCIIKYINYLSGINLYTLADKDTIEMKDNLNLIYKKSDYLT